MVMDVIKWDMNMAYRCFERAAKSYETFFSGLVKDKKDASIGSSQPGEWDDFKSEVNNAIAKRRR